MRRFSNRRIGCRRECYGSVRLAQRPARQLQRRKGTTAVESAITIVLMLSVLFAMLDLGLLIFQSNLLSLACRRLAREAIVRGSDIDPSDAWGPNTERGTAADGSAIAEVIRPLCITMSPRTVRYRVAWPDDTNQIDDQVSVRLTFQRDALTPLTSWMGAVSLSANATMTIVH